MISLILSESSLELVPYELEEHPSVVSHAKKLGKYPSDILLDNSWHFAAMKGIKNEIKRGRPDLVHFSILEATTIPLYYQNKLNLFVHTIDNKVIRFGKNVHIPKSYHRFQGLMEKLFLTKKIESEDEILMEMKNSSLPQLISKIKPTQIIGLTTQGQKTSLDKLVEQIEENSCIILGGFQKGHFNNETDKIIDKSFSINDSSLEAHLVASRLAYEYEKTIFI